MPDLGPIQLKSIRAITSTSLRSHTPNIPRALFYDSTSWRVHTKVRRHGSCTLEFVVTAAVTNFFIYILSHPFRVPTPLVNYVPGLRWPALTLSLAGSWVTHISPRTHRKIHFLIKRTLQTLILCTAFRPGVNTGATNVLASHAGHAGVMPSK